MAKCREHKIPIYFIRFEDLLNEPEQSLSESFAFSLGVKSIEGLNIQERIKATLAQGSAAHTVYPLKDKKQTLNKHADRVDPKLYAHFVEELKDLLYFFGYTNHPEQENPYAFFKFDNHSEEHLKNFKGYQKMN